MPRTARGLHYEVTDLRAPWLRERQSGRPVVFHHGVGASLDIFAEWMPIVAARHPVVRFDMRGFGQSVVPPESHEWTMARADRRPAGSRRDRVRHGAGARDGRIDRRHHRARRGPATCLALCLRCHEQCRHQGRPDRLCAGLAGGDRAHRHQGLERALDGACGSCRTPWRPRPWPGSPACRRSRPRTSPLASASCWSARTSLPTLPRSSSPLLLMMPDRSPYVSLAQASALADLVPQAEIAVFPGARHGLPFSHATDAAGTLLDFLASSRKRPPVSTARQRGATT